MGKKVVVTGMGVIAPKSIGAQNFWETINSSISTAGQITLFDASNFSATIACEVQEYNPEDYFNKKEIRRKDRFTQFALIAADEAIKDSGLEQGTFDNNRAGVLFGSGIGGLATLEAQVIKMNEKGPGKVSPFLIPMFILNMAAGEIAIKYQLKGINYATCTACASSSHAIGTAMKLIKDDKADIMIAGGSEAAICATGLAGFCQMRALSTRNDAPEKASRPFDKERDGFVMSEGAGMLVLESLESAQKRGTKIYAEVAGFGGTADAYHITAPSPDGDGAARSMKMALEDAEMKPEDIDYINAHGTSTPLNDKLETKAIKTAFGEHASTLKISSTKSVIGHMLGAAGAVESIASILAMQNSQIPPTINYEVKDEECDLDYVPNAPVKQTVNAVLSNSLGFGGHNCSVIFRKYQ